MSRAVGIVFGVVNQVLFFATVALLFVFLGLPRRAAEQCQMWVNLALALQYAVVHSWLLWPATRAWITKCLAPPLYGSFFSSVTCLQIWLVYYFWQVDGRVIWQLEGLAAAGMYAGFGASWVLLAYSISLTGFGFQTGFTTWWFWVRRQPTPTRKFRPVGLYHWLRHPIYFSFLGLLWFTPMATADRLLLNLAWTAYIVIGSVLKDQRLCHFLGAEYRKYQARVPGYPLLGWGPLGRIPLHIPAPPTRAMTPSAAEN